MRRKLYPLFWCFLAGTAFAQRGYPPAEQTMAEHVTNYPQHIEFAPSMVSKLKVPQGWKVEVAATGLGKPRLLYPAANGGLYVTRRDAGDVLLLRNPGAGSKFADLITVVSDFPGVHGITEKDGYLYLCNNNEVRRCKINADATLGEPEKIITDLPSGGQHPNRSMDFGPDGMLYISVGSLCNDCKEADPEVAAMLQVDPKTWSRTLFASGLRNTIGFDWHPTTKEMWGLDNGADAKGEEWPPEELNKIVMGGNYGFPYAYGKQVVDKSREEPVGATKEEYVKKTMGSSLEFPAHSAPIAFKFFGNQAPQGWSGDALVAWHGSWNRKNPDGFKVQRIKFSNGKPMGSEDFLSGFYADRARFGRPAGLAILPDGKVYVSDDANGVIYCIYKTK